MAAALVTGTVVPALAVIRDSMAQSREMHARKLLASFAVMTLEEQAAQSMIYWSNATDENNYASYGYPGIAFNLAMSDDPADGGIVNQLMQIEVIVFEDANGDLIPDSGEMQLKYRTKVAKLNSYENEAQ
ncbi:MAG: hypothetical protein AAGD11_02605 [Planctomycetota bacterium]